VQDSILLNTDTGWHSLENIWQHKFVTLYDVKGEGDVICAATSQGIWIAELNLESPPKWELAWESYEPVFSLLLTPDQDFAICADGLYILGKKGRWRKTWNSPREILASRTEERYFWYDSVAKELSVTINGEILKFSASSGYGRITERGQARKGQPGEHGPLWVPSRNHSLMYGIPDDRYNVAVTDGHSLQYHIGGSEVIRNGTTRLVTTPSGLFMMNWQPNGVCRVGYHPEGKGQSWHFFPDLDSIIGEVWEFSPTSRGALVTNRYSTEKQTHWFATPQ
jgi:hypothetical protein